MVLAKPVENETGQTLVAEKTELTEKLLERLDRFGINRISVEGHPVPMPDVPPPDPKKIQLEVTRMFTHVVDDPTMKQLKEIVLRHRLAYAEEILDEMKRADEAEGSASNGE